MRVVQSCVVAHFDGLGESGGHHETDFDQSLSGQTTSRRTLNVLGVVLADQRVERILDTVHNEIRALGAGGSDFLDSTSSDLFINNYNKIVNLGK